jgi:predicted transcriptional regulator
VEDFQDLLFEISSDERYEILLLLLEKPLTITEIAKNRKVTTQEISRHVARLINVRLVNKEINGTHSISPYGALVLKLMAEFIFIAKNREYFSTHVVTQIPVEFVERIGELKSCSYKNVMEFLHYVNQMVKESKEFVWLCVDQYPVTALEPIKEALVRKVRFRVIEPKGMLSRPDLDLETPEEALALAGTRRLPLGQQKMLDKIDVFLVLSESKCALAFPSINGQFDYTGFISQHESPRAWCKELFDHYWN